MDDKYIQKLPKDIILYIISYTYKCQCKTLMNDIATYSKTKDIIEKKYYTRITWLYEFQEIYEKNYLVRDIYSFINGNGYQYENYTDIFHCIVRRHFSLRNLTNTEISSFISKLQKQPSLVNYYQTWIHSKILEENNDNNINLSFNLKSHKINREINFFLGLFTPDEREDFLQKYII